MKADRYEMWFTKNGKIIKRMTNEQVGKSLYEKLLKK